MKVITTAADLRTSDRPVCVAIGVFDGVHLGHQCVIGQAVADAARDNALSAVLTFDRHPNSVVAPSRVPPLIQTLRHKVETIEALGVERLILVKFDEAYSRQSGEEFIRELVQDAGRVNSLSVGAEFAFGHRRSGNLSLLQRLGAELGFAVRGLPAISLHGQAVSSTRIREAIRAGDFRTASEMLGRPYALSGLVVGGERLGRQLGFPTANLDLPGVILPPAGVYAVRAQIDGIAHQAVLNIGVRPTVARDIPETRVEVHLLDFARDLYGRPLEVTFLQRLRDEQKFPSVEALRTQIARDIESARKLFADLPAAKG